MLAFQISKIVAHFISIEKNMRNLKALLFDLDGTLVDSEFVHFACSNEILNELGISFTFEDWIKNYAEFERGSAPGHTIALTVPRHQENKPHLYRPGRSSKNPGPEQDPFDRPLKNLD